MYNLSAAGLGEGHSPQLKELKFVSQHGKTLSYGRLLVSRPLSAEGSTTHQRRYECRLAHRLCRWRRRRGLWHSSVYSELDYAGLKTAPGRRDVVPFPSWVQLSGFLLLAWRLRLPACLGCQMDACFSCSLFRSPGVASCLSSSQDWWVHLESLEPALVTEGERVEDWASDLQLR